MYKVFHTTLQHQRKDRRMFVHVRHPEPAEIIPGMTDMQRPIAPHAIGLAKAKAEELCRNYGPFILIISSLFKRADDHATIIANAHDLVFPDHARPTILRTRLMNERNHGHIFGLSSEEAH